MELLIEEQFWIDLYQKLEKSKQRVYMQFMTFEGDETGLELANKLIELSSKGIEIKLLIDSFTDHYVSDTPVVNPLVFKEVFDTKKMMHDMRKAGIKIKRTRPYGIFGKNFLARNHKKIVIIDNQVYLGGVNISDHNRSWYDFMIRFDNQNILESVARDFDFTWNGFEIDFSENNVYTTKKLEKLYLKLVANAEKEIVVSSPYILDLSLLNILRNKKEVYKRIYTLKHNNIELMNRTSPYLLHNIQKNNTDVFFYKKFSHAKFLIVDKKYLLIGSSNFGKDSFLTMQEIGLLIEDKNFIDEFYRRIIVENKFEKAAPVENKFISNVINRLVYFILFYYAKFIARNIPTLKKEKFNA